MTPHEKIALRHQIEQVLHDLGEEGRLTADTRFGPDEIAKVVSVVKAELAKDAAALQKQAIQKDVPTPTARVFWPADLNSAAFREGVKADLAAEVAKAAKKKAARREELLQKMHACATTDDLHYKLAREELDRLDGKDKTR
jgi:hypothetical protein